MKRTITLLSTAILLIQVAFSQTYHPIPESGAFWQYTLSDIPMFCGCNGLCAEEQIKITGDTTINDLTYHKLIVSGYWYNNNCNQSFYSNGYAGAFRNDIENKKVWFVPVGDLTEGLLYDFNLEIGDTLYPGILNPYNYFDFWVENIDTIQVAGSDRRLYEIRSDLTISEAPLRIIEGIGGQHFYKPMEAWWYFEEGFYFKCLNVADTLFYPGEACEIIVSSNEPPALNKLAFNPNPTNGIINIQIPKPQQNQPLQIQCFNNQGQLVNTKTFTNVESKIKFALGDLSPGIYYLQVRTGSKVFFEKIVVQ